MQILKRAPAAAILALLLTPSMWLAWRSRSMPQLGFHHDDGIYWVSAKSLATGQGYRILSLPGQPFQTKYPPLFPALLSLVWRLNPSFPANLPIAMLLVWMAFPIFILLVWKLLGRYGFSPGERLALTATAALNPFAVLLSFSLIPEMLFTSLLCGVILVVNSRWRARGWIGGALAALAYLTRSAALPLFFTVPLCFALRKQYRQALSFAAAMLPAIAGWQIWMTSHLTPSKDPMTIFYTDYLGYQKYNLRFFDLPVSVWHNLDSYLKGIGNLLSFDFALFESKPLERIVAIAAIAGVVRLARRTREWQFPAFALAYSLILLIWHYPPDLRLLFPIFPLLLAGFWSEIRTILATLRATQEKRTASGRIAAFVGTSLLAAFAIFLVGGMMIVLFGFLPKFLQAQRDHLAARMPAYEYLSAAAPAKSTVYAYDDPILFLYTGRQSCHSPAPPKLIYFADPAALDRLIDDIPAFAREHRMDYLLLTPGDFYRDLHSARAQSLPQILRSEGTYHPVFQTRDISVWSRSTSPPQGAARADLARSRPSGPSN